jgi:hypothetical protein
MEPPSPEVDVKWDSKTHLCNKFLFFEPFRLRLALKYAKSANIINVFVQKFDMGIIKRKMLC